MSDEKTVYSSEAERYEALVSHEDYQHNILRALEQIRDPAGLDVIDLGAGTGRLAAFLAEKAASLVAFDTSHHMLTITREKFRTFPSRRLMTCVADHRRIPLAKSCADMVVSGWSVSYLAVWNPERWRAELETWLDEMQRILRPGGSLILFESLGTGNETPVRLPHLSNFYPWLDEQEFRNTWIRTDYLFESPEQGAELAGFFFGKEMAGRIRSEELTVLPECTGVWLKEF